MKFRFTQFPENIHNQESINRFLAEVFLEIQAAMDAMEPEQLRLRTLHVEPARPRPGDLARADGADWNPGGGEGLYEFMSDGSWERK
jgi:hypothetical protein